MAQWITVKYKGSKCKACGTELVVGSRAKWYKPGIAYHEANWEKGENNQWIAVGCKNTTKEQSIPF